MISIKLKLWQSIQEWVINLFRGVTKNATPSTPLDYNDLAFTLAAASEISKTLPLVLTRFQEQLNDVLVEQQRPQLFVLFSQPSSSESFLHHSQDLSPSATFIQAIHRKFTVGRAPTADVIDIGTDSNSLKIIPKRLFEHDNQVVWLLFAFHADLPNPKQLSWHSASIENTLSKGLQAWHQREDQINQAIEAERAMYAAELHDSLAQVLGYLRMKSVKLDKLCDAPEYQALQPISKDLANYTQCAYHQTRELITSSRLSMQSDNLSHGVINSIKEFEHQSAIVFDLDNRLPLNMLTPQQSMQMLYIIRESLSNIVRHSHATFARVVLLLKNSQRLEIQIEDNGIGIDPDAARTDSFGLQIMKERAERIGAELTINPGSDGGTRICLNLTIGDDV